MIRCDSEHRYWLGPARIPGFSEICTDLGIIKPNIFYTNAGREEGIALHQWLHFLAQNKIPKTLPDQRIAGRVDGIKNFIRDTGFKFVGGEEPKYDPVVRFATTPDIWGAIGIWTWTIDCKRGAKTKTHALQTAAQKIALSANGFRAQKRGALYLKENGDYRLEEHTDPLDERRWAALVGAYYAKKSYI